MLLQEAQLHSKGQVFDAVVAFGAGMRMGGAVPEDVLVVLRRLVQFGSSVFFERSLSRGYSVVTRMRRLASASAETTNWTLLYQHSHPSIVWGGKKIDIRAI